MDLPKMRQVIAIHRHGSFAKAAETLGMSQPSLSRSISRLEDELKIKIFERTASGSALTPVGELLMARLQRVVADTEALMRDATLFAGGEGGVVRIGISSALRGPFVQDFMLRAADAHPNLRIHLEINNRMALAPQLASRDLDLIFVVASSREQLDPATPASRLSDLDFVVAASPGHPLAGRCAIPFAEFLRHRYAGPVAPLVTTFFDVSAEDLVPFYSSNDYEGLLPLATAGLATIIAPRHCVRPLLDDGRLVTLDVTWVIDLVLLALSTRAAAGAPVIRKLIDHARQVVAALETQGPAAVAARVTA
jgi:DNA-binding transcriptional LysR family regulator